MADNDEITATVTFDGGAAFWRSMALASTRFNVHVDCEVGKPDTVRVEVTLLRNGSLSMSSIHAQGAIDALSAIADTSDAGQN